MAEKQSDKKQDKQEKPKKAEKPVSEKKRPEVSEDEKNEILVRIYGYDIPGSKGLMTGLTRIKGISWAISNALCLKLNMSKSKKVGELSKPEIQQIETFLREMPVADFLKNRRHDIDSGDTNHHLYYYLYIKT